MKNLAFLYGHPPAHDDVWLLSPYEFVCYWEVVLARYSLSEEENDEYEYHAELTPRGRAKLSKRCGADLIPGVDYQVKESGGCGWLPFPGDDKDVEKYRHTWVMQRRRRSRDPSFLSCPMPRRGPMEQERTAALLMTYFHPHTMRRDLADEHVPYLGSLQGSHPTWVSAMQHWFDGRVLCGEVKTLSE